MKKLAILYGGKSGEHDVSIRSAFSVLGHIDRQKYDIIPVYITEENEWNIGVMQDFSHHDELKFSSSDTSMLDLLQEVDVFFPLIHGPYGEDGCIQGLLEMFQKPYVGCGVLASSVGMDKIMTKKVLQSEGIPSCEYQYYTKKDVTENMAYVLQKIEDGIGYPCFVKPANLGSSVGISKAKNQEALIFALHTAATHDDRIIVEATVYGRELEIGVIGNDTLHVSEIGEVSTTADFYDYETKYIDLKNVQLHIPAEVPERVKADIQHMAKKVFRAVSGKGLSRIDFFWDEKSDILYVNEINTMPGFTPSSMFPMLFQQVGYSYRDLLDTLITLAVEYHAEKKKLAKKN